VTHFDVFNGDADGLCALHQLRLARPIESVLVTGVKRDIELLPRVAAVAGDAVTALDISLESSARRTRQDSFGTPWRRRRSTHVKGTRALSRPRVPVTAVVADARQRTARRRWPRCRIGAA
jgi:hypothetical protein